MPAAAIYFRDPDGHSLEYLAMLDEPPGPTYGPDLVAVDPPRTHKQD